MQAIEPVSARGISHEETQRPKGGRTRTAASAARAGWQSRYVLALCLADSLVGLCAASWALVLRFGSSGREPYMRDYL